MVFYNKKTNIFLFVLFVFLTGCKNSENEVLTENQITLDSNIECSMEQSTDSAEENIGYDMDMTWSSMVDTDEWKLFDYVSVEEFMKYYELSDADVEGLDISGMIWYEGLQQNDLSEKDWYSQLKLKAEKGENYYLDRGYFTKRPNRKLREQEDFRDAKYIYYRKETMTEFENLITGDDILIDVRNGMIYFLSSEDFCKDLRGATRNCYIQEEEVEKLLEQFDDMNLYDRKVGKSDYTPKKAGEYMWELYVMKTPYETIFYAGGTSEDIHDVRFHEIDSYITNLLP